MKTVFINYLRKSALSALLDLEKLALLSERAEACPIQDPFRIRARFLGWKTASLLLDEKGAIKKESLDELIRVFENESYPVGQSEGDAWIFQHLFSCLRELKENGAIGVALKKCSLPLSGKEAEEIVRDTLWPDEIGPLSHVHVKRAVLTAWFTLLRQATGSCFATAPAMLIQKENPLRMIQDLDAILSAGELRRGVYAAPLHKELRSGDLQKPIDPLSAAHSPGLEVAFQAANVPFPKIAFHGGPAKEFLKEGLLLHFGLSRKDLAKETVPLAPQAGLLWERLGGHYGGFSSKTREIYAWEKAVKKAESAFFSLADCDLLRSWEYTLASFSDVKVEFAHWNLFVSLGMDPEKTPPGIGAFLLVSIQNKLDAVSRTMAEIQSEHERAVQGVHAAERLLAQASSAADQSRFKSELYAQVHTANSLSSRMEEERKIALWLSQFFSHFLNEATEKLQEAFQEVFDSSLNTGEAERFEDSPAGFRLLYKSGRSAAASWERIEEASQFVHAVYKFFESLEGRYFVDLPMKSQFTQIMTELLQYIRSEAFISGALVRAKENKKAKSATPWAYQSGAVMQNLVQSYYDLPEKPNEFSRNIRTPLELHEFLREAAKKNGGKTSLMHSPTHGFLFHPSLMGPEDALNNGLRFVKSLFVSSDQTEFLIERLSLYLPFDVRPLFHSGCRQNLRSENIAGLRSLLLSGSTTAGQLGPGIVDSFLYEALPVLTYDKAKQAIKSISLRLQMSPPNIPKEPFFLPIDLVRIMKEALMAAKGAFSFKDWDLLLAHAARQEGVIYPSPILFADTNWSDWSFGIVVNAATEKPQLWRLSRTGLTGAPMHEWEHVFSEGGRWAVLMTGKSS